MSKSDTSSPTTSNMEIMAEGYLEMAEINLGIANEFTHLEEEAYLLHDMHKSKQDLCRS